MAVDIIVVSFNTRDGLRQCLSSVYATCASIPATRTIVVDNGSSDGSCDMVRTEFPKTVLISLQENIGFGPANNRGLEAGDSEYVLFLNSDAQLTEGTLSKLMAFINGRPRCVIVGPRLTYPDGRFQASCRRFPTPLRSFWSLAGMEARLPVRVPMFENWLAEEEHRPGAHVDMVSGACFLARRDYLESIGGFDENLFLYEEETDISLPARRRDLEVRYCADATVVHGKGVSVQGDELKDTALFHLYRSKYYCFRKHYGAWAALTTFLTDLGVLWLLAAVNKLRGTATDAGRRLTFCRKAYRGAR